MTARKPMPDGDHLIQLYRSGESIKALAERFGVSRGLMTIWLRDRLGVQLRSMSDAQLILSSRRSPEERHRLASFAFEAKRDRPNSLASRCRGALTAEGNISRASPGELQLAEQLHELGVAVIHQRAIGPYNADLAALPVAVEVFGGNWHNYARDAKRLNYLLDHGWSLVVVWDQIRCPLGVGASHYLASFIEQARSDPAFTSEYRVIRGDGEELARGCKQIDELALVPSQRRSRRRRA